MNNAEQDPNELIIRTRTKTKRGLQFNYDWLNHDDRGIEIFEDCSADGYDDNYIYLTQMEALKLRDWLNTLDINMVKVR